MAIEPGVSADILFRRITIKGDASTIHVLMMTCLDVLAGVNRMSSMMIPGVGIENPVEVVLVRSEDILEPHPLLDPSLKKK